MSKVQFAFKAFELDVEREGDTIVLSGPLTFLVPWSLDDFSYVDGALVYYGVIQDRKYSSLRSRVQRLSLHCKLVGTVTKEAVGRIFTNP